MRQKIVTITSKGQVTIPKEYREALGINGSTKAIIRKKKNSYIIEPIPDFWSIFGSLKSDIVLSDKELRHARRNFEKK